MHQLVPYMQPTSQLFYLTAQQTHRNKAPLRSSALLSAHQVMNGMCLHHILSHLLWPSGERNEEIGNGK